MHPSVMQVLPCAQAASADVSAREARVRAAEEQLGTLRTQVGQQKAAADSRQASLEAQAVELQVRFDNDRRKPVPRRRKSSIFAEDWLLLTDNDAAWA